MNMNTRFVGKPLCRVIIAVVMVFFSLNAMSQYFTEVYKNNIFTFEEISPTTVKVINYSGNTYSNNKVTITIPSTISRTTTGLHPVTYTYQVVSIGDSAFVKMYYGRYQLDSLVIESGITSIGKNAFDSCTFLRHVNIPSGITSIGENAFSRCERLKTLNIQGGPSIGKSAFQGCKALESVTIAGASSIGAYAFCYDTSLTSLSIPNVTSIGSCAFEATSITSVTIPNSCSHLGRLPYVPN